MFVITGRKDAIEVTSKGNDRGSHCEINLDTENVVIGLSARRNLPFSYNLMGKVTSGNSTVYYTLSSPERVENDNAVDWVLWPGGTDGVIDNTATDLERQGELVNAITALKFEATGVVTWNLLG